MTYHDRESIAVERVRRLVDERRRLQHVIDRQREHGRACCLACGSPDVTADGWFTDGHDRFEVRSCHACGLSQLERHLTEAEVARLEDENRHYQIEDEDIEARVVEHSFIVNLVERYCGVGRLLDVGCSRGYKLEAARRAKWEVEGIELSPRSCAFARAMGLSVYCGTLESYVPDRRYNAIIAWHVLEHVPSPSLFLGIMMDLLEPGGWLFLQVPSYGLYRPLANWSSHPENFCRIHYWYFTAATLGCLLSRAGFHIAYEYDDPQFKHLTFVARRPADLTAADS